MLARKIAIPISEDKMSGHFGHCEYFMFFEVQNDKIINQTKSIPPPHKQGSYPLWLAENKVTEIIVNGIGQRAIDILQDKKIKYHIGVDIDFPQILVSKLIEGTIETNINLCDH